MYIPQDQSLKKLSKKQLIHRINEINFWRAKDKEQITFLHGSVAERNRRAERAERGERAALAQLEAIRKLFVDGSSNEGI